MATTEHNALIRAKDAKGNSLLIYPITKAENVDGLDESLDGKANASHTHDDRYYTESEIDSKLSGKSDTSHTHSQYANQNAFSKVTVGSTTIEADSVTDTLTLSAGSNITLTPDATGDKVTIAATDTVYTHPNSGVTAGTYKSVTVNAQGHVTSGTNPTTLAEYGITDAEAKGSAAAALTSAKSYTDDAIADEVEDRDSAIATAKSSAISTASSDATTKANVALSEAKIYADSAATTAANNVKNDLLNGAGAAYDTLKELGDLIDTNTDAIDALEAVAAGKADAAHDHAISDVTGLQTALDSKAASSHGTHVTYSTTAPVMDGTASAGTASTVARSDHKHPTDTSRASQSDLTTHTGDATVHITSTERINWNEKSSVQLDGDRLSTLNIHKLSQEEYDQAVVDGTIDENALYLTPDSAVQFIIWEEDD